MIELLSLLGGGAAGFLFKLIGTMVSNQAELAKLAIERQAAADESHDRAELNSVKDTGQKELHTIPYECIVSRKKRCLHHQKTNTRQNPPLEDLPNRNGSNPELQTPVCNL